MNPEYSALLMEAQEESVPLAAHIADQLELYDDIQPLLRSDGRITISADRHEALKAYIRSLMETLPLYIWYWEREE